MNELKRCAHCGAEAMAETSISGQGWHVKCPGCRVSTGWRKTKAEAIADWNRRADGWVKCSERMPTKKDGDTFGRVVAAGPTGTWALEWWAIPESIATRWCKLPEAPEDEP